ncbi:MAG: cobalt-precorrin 5A hydrolase [Lachnospiraceae bacterium]
MELSIISFTGGGRELAKEIRSLTESELTVRLYCKSADWREQGEEIEVLNDSISGWAGKQFEQGRAMLFIGALGIAVRAIAPHLKDKLTDVPVLVMDEKGKFIIPVLSGHFGGANELAGLLAGRKGAVCVTTTATDINGLFSVDVFARKNNLAVYPKEGIKQVSSALLAGKQVTIAVDGKYEGTIPNELTHLRMDRAAEADEVSVLVSPRRNRRIKAQLRLYPKVLLLGIGCRKGKSAEELEQAVKAQLEEHGLPLEAVAGIASISIKKEEPGLIELAETLGLPFYTFSGEELCRLEGDYSVSEFVREQTGVGNVCERAAMAACGTGGRIILKKQAGNGITIAAAEKKWSVFFDETESNCNRNRAGNGRDDECAGAGGFGGV